MENNNNRIISIELTNIKNVAYGLASFYNIKTNKQKTGSTITGIYGQNGSGKTTIINCFELLKTLALRESHFGYDKGGKRIENQFDYLPTLGKNNSSIIFSFLIFYKNEKYEINYRLQLYRNENYLRIKSEEIYTTLLHDAGLKSFSPLKYDFTKISNINLYDGINHRDTKPNENINRVNVDTRISLESQLLSCRDTGKSMIFSERNIEYLTNNVDPKVSLIGNLISELGNQIAMNLFIYEKSIDALNQIGLGAVFGIYKEEKREIHGVFQMTDFPFYVESSKLGLYEKARQEIEVFISSVVPNFNLKLDTLGTKVESNIEYTKIGFSKLYNNLPLPLSVESSGIKKLFTICSALIYCYGNSNCWLIVDEFDSGVFEDLLGQIFQVLEKKGKGQVIFTAHNLSPLERIEPNSIIFTTNNINNRFVRFTSVHESNNLRSLYLRALKLGGTKEPLSSGVDIDSIDEALYTAYKIMR